MKKGGNKEQNGAVPMYRCILPIGLISLKLMRFISPIHAFTLILAILVALHV